MSSPALKYKLKTQTETFGSVMLQIEALENLNQTIDDLFAEIETRSKDAKTESERQASAALLEELCPYFGQVWPSARALCEILAAEGEGLAGKKVLELGCGLAVPSLLAARLGAQVTATDFHPDVPLFLERNLQANGISSNQLRYLAIDWRAKGNPGEQLGLFDLVIGSDVLYERQHALELAATASRLVTSQGKVLIADPARPYLQGFVDRMSEQHFTSETRILKAKDDHPTSSSASPYKEIFVVEFRRRPY